MNKKQAEMRTFIESLRDSDNSHVVDGILEGFDVIMTEGVFDKVVNMASDVGRMISPSKAKELSAEEKAKLKRKYQRAASKESQSSYALDSTLKSVMKYAESDPDKVETWMKTELVPAIKEGKANRAKGAKATGLVDSIARRRSMVR